MLLFLFFFFCTTDYTDEHRLFYIYIYELNIFSVEICVICGELNYSSLNASAGSTFAARITGMAVPIKEMTKSSR